MRRLAAKGEVAEASHWLDALAAAGNAQALNACAWLRATALQAALRDGRLALACAQRAVALERNAVHLDALAAAYAELGWFAEAVEAQHQALALAEVDDSAVVEMQAHLASYLTESPWRE